MNLFDTPIRPPVNILLVEDDDGDAKGLMRAFKKAKIADPIFRAFDGLEALEMLQGAGKNTVPSPRLLLVDMNMPRMNGIQLIQAMRADPALKQTIVFMLTTSKRDEDKLAAYNLNVAGYIVKSNAGEDFLHLLNLMDCYWRIVEIL
jgi:CheY-like chemotaxis protein